MIKAVLFDWDGTLVDTKSAIVRAFQDVTTTILGRPYPAKPKDIASLFRHRARDTFAGLASSDEHLEQLLEEYHRSYMRHSQESAPFDHVAETLSELGGRGLRIGVVTSKVARRLDADAHRFGLADLVDVVVPGDSYRYAKPHPCSVEAALSLLGASPAAAMYVGDGPHDVLAGRRAGTTTVAATYGVYPEHELRAANPDRVIDDIRQVVRIIDELGLDSQEMASQG